jgi:hypothetical protein
VAEIDGLIGELRSLRDYLLKEGLRIQRELAEYNRLNHGALECGNLGMGLRTLLRKDFVALSAKVMPCHMGFKLAIP